jgi:hypothetical protein
VANSLPFVTALLIDLPFGVTVSSLVVVISCHEPTGVTAHVNELNVSKTIKLKLLNIFIFNPKFIL